MKIGNTIMIVLKRILPLGLLVSVWLRAAAARVKTPLPILRVGQVNVTMPYRLLNRTI